MISLSLLLFISTVKEAFNNVLIFNDTCLKWRRNVRGADMEDRYLVSNNLYFESKMLFPL